MQVIGDDTLRSFGVRDRQMGASMDGSLFQSPNGGGGNRMLFRNSVSRTPGASSKC